MKVTNWREKRSNQNDGRTGRREGQPTKKQQKRKERTRLTVNGWIGSAQFGPEEDRNGCTGKCIATPTTTESLSAKFFLSTKTLKLEQKGRKCMQFGASARI